MKFKPGDKVRKVNGSYQATGEVKAAFLSDDGSARYVFRFDAPAGMLHIFSDANLAPAEPAEPVVLDSGGWIGGAREMPCAECCKRCAALMRPGTAMQSTTYTGDEGTCSPAGPGRLIECSKCTACGWSVVA